MRLLFFNIFIGLGLIALGCNRRKPPLIKTNPKIDTSKSFRIRELWATPKHSIDFNSFDKSVADTLDFAICGEYVYSPFGSIKNKSKFGSSLLRNFNVVDRADTTEIGPVNLQILKHNSSKLIFFYDNDPEAFKHSDIFKGEIHDSDVQFVNGIKIGMDIADFYKTFFDYFPDELKDKYKFFVLESCVLGIKHIYTFENKKLRSVKFITDYAFKANY